jgi:hypothetical protein
MKPKARTLKLLLTNGTLDGYYNVVDTNTTVSVYSCPRDSIGELFEDEASDGWGVYFLISETQVSKNQEITYRDNQYLFYLRIFDKVSGQELAPLSFIEEQAKKFILHQRKLKLLEKIKESLYEKEILNKDVKIYVN